MTTIPMFLQPSDIRAALAADRADDEAEAAQLRADEQALAVAEEAAAVELAQAAADAFRTSEPPTDIANVDDLPPQRARLVKYCAWLAALEAEHTSLTEGRTAYLTAQKVPTLTKQAIDALVKEDRSGLVALIQAGGKGVSTHALRGHERKLLAEKLSQDEHAASVAVDALIEVEAKIDALEQQIGIVKSRHGEFLSAALQEHLIATTGAVIIQQAEALRQSIITAQGAYGALQKLRGVSHFARPSVLQLPTPRLAGEQWHSASEDKPGYGTGLAAGYQLDFPVHLQDQEQRRWTEMSKALAINPRADLGAK